MCCETYLKEGPNLSMLLSNERNANQLLPVTGIVGFTKYLESRG